MPRPPLSDNANNSTMATRWAARKAEEAAGVVRPSRTAHSLRAGTDEPSATVTVTVIASASKRDRVSRV